MNVPLHGDVRESEADIRPRPDGTEGDWGEEPRRRRVVLNEEKRGEGDGWDGHGRVDIECRTTDETHTLGWARPSL